MITTELTTEQHIALLRHLAGGKTLDVVAAIMRLSRDQVLDVASKHGYPDPGKLSWAADVLAEKQTEAAKAEIPAATPAPRPASTSPSSVTHPAARPTQGPDEIRVLLNTAKGHPSKRIQAAADRVFDQLDKLRGLLREDQEKHAEKRKREAEKAAARAEVERLERQLAEAKAKLRGTTPPSAPKPAAADSVSDGPSAKEIRAWARDNDVECPDRGQVPALVREAYHDAHQAGAA